MNISHRSKGSFRTWLALSALVAAASGGDANAGGFPTLNKIKPGPSRFVPALGGQAYLDKETGLVWEKAPDASSMTWANASYHCYHRLVGNRMGWRLPAIEEIYSLFEGNGAGGRQLATGHPFENLTNDNFWTSTRVAYPDTQALYVVHRTTGATSWEPPHTAFEEVQAWCVRAGVGHDPQGFTTP